MSIFVTDQHGAKTVSQACIDCIKRNEGCKLTAYLDRLANPPVWTIGFGDTLGVRQGMNITQEEAEARLMNRLVNEFVPGVLRALKGAPVTQSQLDAMASLSWNIGVGRVDNPETAKNEGTGFSGSSVCRLHRKGDYAGAADAFLKWNMAGGKVLKGLTRRREEERTMYLSSGLPTKDVAPPEAPEVGGPIVAIQEVLVNAGVLPKGHVDGLWGKESQAALDKLT